jgi:hypothetical protein
MPQALTDAADANSRRKPMLTGERARSHLVHPEDQQRERGDPEEHK